ncbi:hypothetical protein [Levilactobacillus fujinensis]|uniref:Uncharacterized protein n=1 Tax=Levilactobacillus fujinensis TaxID=2486024 RepID=A0ABW1TEC8_9LACO
MVPTILGLKLGNVAQQSPYRPAWVGSVRTQVEALKVPSLQA